jgi:ribose 5-phosphate isomerase A
MTEKDRQKQAAALHSVRYVESDMTMGLGSGSTAELAVRELGRLVREEGLKIKGVPTSERTARLADEVGIPLTTLDECPRLDVTIDGADEVVPGTLDVIKGLGGALLREKIVALSSRLVVLVVDEGKVVPMLGDHTLLPVEVVPFGWGRTRDLLSDLGCEPQLRRSGDDPYITDGGHYLLDCRFPPIAEPSPLAAHIKAITGVVDVGLFVGIAHRVVVAGKEGIRVMEREEG